MERCPPALPPGAAPQHGVLLRRTLAGLTLDDEPFATLGAPLGLRAEAVIELLQHWVGCGLVQHIGPVFAADAAALITGDWGQALLQACSSGLPLVQRPYEALGAMLGVPAAQVQAQLAAWLARGRVLRVAAVLAPTGLAA